MAGYITKPITYVYEGEYKNGTGDPVENGSLVVIDTANAGYMTLPTADTNTKFLCKEVTTIYDGITAYRFIVTALASPVYFVENGFEYFCDGCGYDNRNHAVPEDELLRAHPLQHGEEFVTTMVTGTPAVGTEYGVLADGTIG